MSESSKSKPDGYDPVTDYHYLKFENRCLRASGDDFQNLFEAIMVRARPGEFERVRPYGKYGDRKCDGLIESEGIIFQVYSPDELKQAEVQKKIDEDLEGAVRHWSDILKKWVFVYNVKRGIAPDIKLMLQQKQQQYSDIKIDCWNNDYLWEIVRGLSLQKRCEILGAPPQSTANTKQVAAHSVPHQDHKTKWREICRGLLNHWKGLTTNALMRRSGVRFQLNEIFVPLGVVERREKSKHRPKDDASAEQGSKLYEEKITPISQNDFFEHVLRQQQSKHSQGKRIAIIGEPGAGKTTQLQKIGDWILEETDGIPIWIPLAEVGTRKLREYLLGDWLQTAIQELEVSPEHRDELGQLLKTGKVWLLLDGVDEMAISDALYQMATQMREGWLQNMRIVLTCRLNVWDAGKNALDSFDVYRNLDFEYPTEVHQLVDKWFATEPALQKKLKVELEQPGKERIQDMVKNPLRLTLLCYSWQLRQGELPETKASLYEWFVDTFYEWNKGKIPTQLSAAKREGLNRALGELAKEAIDQETSRFRLRERFVNQFLGAADDEDSLFYLALQLGWLNRIGVAAENPFEDIYAFFHPTFQEYFAALAIDDWSYFLPPEHVDKPINNARYRIFELSWKEVLLIWLGRRNIAQHLQDGFVEKLLDFKDGCTNFYSDQAWFIAAVSISNLKVHSKTKKILNRIIDWNLGYFNEDVQKWFNYPTFLQAEAREVLKQVDQNQKIATNILVNRIKSTKNDWIKLIYLLELEVLNPNHPYRNEILLELQNSCIEKIVIEASYLLQKSKVIDPLSEEIGKVKTSLKNIYVSDDVERQDSETLPSSLEELIVLIDANEDILTTLRSIYKVRNEYIDNPIVFDFFSKILRSKKLNDDLLDVVAKTLLEIDHNYLDAFLYLMKRLTTLESDTYLLFHHYDVIQYLNKIFLPIAITSLKDFAGIENSQTYLAPLHQFHASARRERCQNVLWHCAQNMSYPDFYQAWHSSSLIDDA